MTPQNLLDRLRERLGTDAVLVGESVHGRATSFWDPTPLSALAIVRPRTTAEVSEAMRLCQAAGQPVVPQGGRTGLAGAATTGAAEIALSLERMTAVEALDARGRTLTVQAGVALQTVQEAAESVGLMFPLDFGARGSCTIGGNIATNAGGNRVLRYGTMRALVLGLEAVLADGSVVSALHPYLKNNTGYDWKHLLIGSEGTLGIVTRAVLRMVPAPRRIETALTALDSFEAVSALFDHLDRTLAGGLSAFELLRREFYALNAPERSAPLERGYPYYVLVERYDGSETGLESALEQALAAGLIQDAVVAKSEADRAALWNVRETTEPSLRRHAARQCFDVSLSQSAMEAYVAEVEARLADTVPAAELLVFGHFGDGNLHLVVGSDSALPHEAVDTAVYETLRRYAGSVSAEHGIGLDKRAFLGFSRSQEELALMRALKRTLDPCGILNPGKVLES